MNLRDIDRLEEETAQRQLVEKDELNRRHVRERDVIKEFRALATRNGNGHHPAAAPDQHVINTDLAQPKAESLISPLSPRNDTKKALIISLMERKNGATNADLLNATTWEINSIRGQISALRKAGYNIASEKRGDGQRAYFIR